MSRRNKNQGFGGGGGGGGNVQVKKRIMKEIQKLYQQYCPRGGVRGTWKEAYEQVGVGQGGFNPEAAKKWKKKVKLANEGIRFIGMDGDDYMHLQFWLQGPEGTPYGQNLSKGGYWFKISVKLTSEYPMSPPKVSFQTPIWHPNVSERGEICLDILKNKWSPALQIRAVILSIQALLGGPNFDDPLNEKAKIQGMQWQTKLAAYRTMYKRVKGTDVPQEVEQQYRKTHDAFWIQAVKQTKSYGQSYLDTNMKLKDQSQDLDNQVDPAWLQVLLVGGDYYYNSMLISPSSADDEREDLDILREVWKRRFGMQTGPLEGWEGPGKAKEIDCTEDLKGHWEVKYVNEDHEDDEF